MISILIVENDAVQAESLQLKIAECGYRIAAVIGSGEAAIEQANALRPDIVLMSLALPGATDGIEASRRIREGCGIPVLYLTPCADENFFLGTGVTEPHEYLLIPATAREIRLVVETIRYRRKAETAAREAQEKAVAQRTAELERAQSIAHIGSWDYDLVTEQLVWSDELYRIYGVSPETFTPSVDNLLKLIHPDDRSAMQTWIASCFSGQSPKALEFRCIWPDNTVHEIEGQGRLMRDDEGRPIFLSGTAQDITERKQAEEALRIAAVAFETQDAILITDTHANIIRVNQAFTEVTGYRADEVLGKNPRMMSSGRHDRAFYIELWQQLLHSGSWSGEIWHRRKNGEIYPKWMNISAVKNDRQEITHYVAIFSDITARKRVEETIHQLAFYDELTKLPNRRLLLDRLQSALNASTRRNDYGALMFIDLDHFKELNDTLGHEHGDLLLIEVGRRIKSCVREMDTVARFGGDEYVVLIESFSQDMNDAMNKVMLVAEKIRNALTQPYLLKEYRHQSSPSIGICLYHGNEEPLDALIERADMAMYEVKKSGRNAVRFFDPVMQHALMTQEMMLKDLRQALAKRQFQLQYQVQVDKNNRPLGAEAFVRWIHPTHGLILPGKFIPIAEESNLIIDIDRWVLDAACRQIALWSANDQTRHLTLTVNISTRLFALPGFVDEVAHLMKTYRTDPALLKLELSERIVQSDLNLSIDKIRALRKLGCKLSIDNFATLYSSLSSLKLLSPDQLKIHQDFVHNISLDAHDAQMARTIIDYAKSLDLDIFAEGVETEDERNFLSGQDCNIFQGYLFGKPMPIEQFDELLVKL